jgi:hypothetical protein
MTYTDEELRAYRISRFTTIDHDLPANAAELITVLQQLTKDYNIPIESIRVYADYNQMVMAEILVPKTEEEIEMEYESAAATFYTKEEEINNVLKIEVRAHQLYREQKNRERKARKGY